MVNWVGNNCLSLMAILFKSLKFKEFKSQQSMGVWLGQIVLTLIQKYMAE